MTQADAPRLEAALQRFDQINAQDPEQETTADGARPRALLYGRRMSETLEQFQPEASEALRLAVRAQHLRRWALARGDYPAGREGYRAWREALADYHARLAAEVLVEVGYEAAEIERVGALIRKQRLKRDAEAQALEDVACLVFLQHYALSFAAGHSEDKVIDILRKTWRKMSPRGREAALQAPLAAAVAELVRRAQE